MERRGGILALEEQVHVRVELARVPVLQPVHEQPRGGLEAGEGVERRRAVQHGPDAQVPPAEGRVEVGDPVALRLAHHHGVALPVAPDGLEVAGEPLPEPARLPRNHGEREQVRQLVLQDDQRLGGAVRNHHRDGPAEDVLARDADQDLGKELLQLGGAGELDDVHPAGGLRSARGDELHQGGAHALHLDDRLGRLLLRQRRSQGEVLAAQLEEGLPLGVRVPGAGGADQGGGQSEAAHALPLYREARAGKKTKGASPVRERASIRALLLAD
ncbi:MAG TPA: hypothetical protein VKB92_09125 [Myxococcales bacterium]|nr:hypothetical protein [Myxococcales bacterium]